MRHMLRTIVLTAALAGLSACGFSPLYAGPGGRGAAAPLANIRIETGGEESRIDYLFAQAMRDKIGAHSPTGEYVLETRLTERRAGFGIRVDDVATRYESTVRADYRLIRASNGEVVASGRRMGVASYDVTADPYAELASEQRAVERAVSAAAEKVRLDLALYFSSLDGES